jgi:ribosomal protein L29
MNFNKLSELNNTELLQKKVELETQLQELMLNSSLTNMEKPHMKSLLKKDIARVNCLLAKGDK